MIPLLNVGRLLMVVWIVYGLILIFAPQLLHLPPSQMRGLAYCVAAYLLGTSLAKLSGNIEWIDPPIEEQVQYLGLPLNRPGYAAKLAAFNRALASLYADGTVKSLIAEID